jgi:nucleoside 2-deoxyribosyltransferase
MELLRKKLVSGHARVRVGEGITDFPDLNLTLEGWERYEAEKRGQTRGNYGFIALEFNDALLDPFVRDIVKPCVKTELGFDLVDMRDVAKAGVIDNIMRAQIRDAAFVLVDLTHDNSGAYWEAGYAEGLGKPVIYLCERAKFEQVTTHFDTNHCTTVVWSADQNEEFQKQLVATLRRSLNLFPK